VYSIKDSTLSIEITHSTMAACPEGSLEDQFVRDLTAGVIYFLKDGDLYIDLKYDSGTMKFTEGEGK
jgi:heat shock protein HslJ